MVEKPIAIYKYLALPREGSTGPSFSCCSVYVPNSSVRRFDTMQGGMGYGTLSSYRDKSTTHAMLLRSIRSSHAHMRTKAAIHCL